MQDKKAVFWPDGMAGTGKSTIARTIILKYQTCQRLGASFFFTSGKSGLGSSKLFVTTIATQLASSVPGTKQHIRGAVAENLNILACATSGST